jgi:hypothetical protein
MTVIGFAGAPALSDPQSSGCAENSVCGTRPIGAGWPTVNGRSSWQDVKLAETTTTRPFK